MGSRHDGYDILETADDLFVIPALMRKIAVHARFDTAF